MFLIVSAQIHSANRQQPPQLDQQQAVSVDCSKASQHVEFRFYFRNRHSMAKTRVSDLDGNMRWVFGSHFLCRVLWIAFRLDLRLAIFYYFTMFLSSYINASPCSSTELNTPKESSDFDVPHCSFQTRKLNEESKVHVLSVLLSTLSSTSQAS